jgi:hypothetical protein
MNSITEYSIDNNDISTSTKKVAYSIKKQHGFSHLILGASIFLFSNADSDNPVNVHRCVYEINNYYVPESICFSGIFVPKKKIRAKLRTPYVIDKRVEPATDKNDGVINEESNMEEIINARAGYLISGLEKWV